MWRNDRFISISTNYMTWFLYFLLWSNFLWENDQKRVKNTFIRFSLNSQQWTCTLDLIVPPCVKFNHGTLDVPTHPRTQQLRSEGVYVDALIRQLGDLLIKAIRLLYILVCFLFWRIRTFVVHIYHVRRPPLEPVHPEPSIAHAGHSSVDPWRGNWTSRALGL